MQNERRSTTGRDEEREVRSDMERESARRRDRRTQRHLHAHRGDCRDYK